MAALGSSATVVDKNKELQRKLLEVWLEVLPDFDYSGEDGYIRFQAALVDHNMDPEIATQMQAAVMAIQSRAARA